MGEWLCPSPGEQGLHPPELPEELLSAGAPLLPAQLTQLCSARGKSLLQHNLWGALTCCNYAEVHLWKNKTALPG